MTFSWFLLCSIIYFLYKQHKSTDPVEFLVVGPDWPGPDLMLGKPWLQKNGAMIDMCNSQLILHDNFAIPIVENK